MLYKLNNKAVKKIYNVISKDNSITDKAQARLNLQCDLGNALLHSAMKMTRSEYIRYFNEVYIKRANDKYNLNLNFSDFSFDEEGKLNNHGKRKLIESYENRSIKNNHMSYILDFTEKCFSIERLFIKKNKKDFEMFNITFTKEDFY